MQGRVITSPHYQGGSLAAPSHGCDPEQVSGEGVDPGNAENGGAWTVDASPPPTPHIAACVCSGERMRRHAQWTWQCKSARGTGDAYFCVLSYFGQAGLLPHKSQQCDVSFYNRLVSIEKRATT